MPYLSAQRLTQLNCKRRPVWDPDNIKRIAEARRADDTRDWYFPVVFKNYRSEDPALRTPAAARWSTWFGIWHPAADDVLGGHRLPPLTHLPHEWTCSSGFGDTVASSGGLLLIKTVAGEIPAAFETMVCVYKSTCNSWTCSRFPEPRPWGKEPYDYPRTDHRRWEEWGYRSGSAHVGGRLYFADILGDDIPGGMTDDAILESEAERARFLRLFEVEAEVGRWNLLHQYTVRKFNLPFLTGPDWAYLTDALPFVELVECMEDLYAVIPARIDDALIRGAKQTSRWRSEVMTCNDGDTELEAMPLVFHIMQLQGAGDGLDHRVARMWIPKTTRDIQNRREELVEKSNPYHMWTESCFRCTARKSVTWVACEDYLLQYDVVSRVSKTRIIPVHPTDDNTLRFPYATSFHMKP